MGRSPAPDPLQNPDTRVDCVVCTLVLCSVDDLRRNMECACMQSAPRSHRARLIYEVLKPGGVFVVMEHVAAARGSAARVAQPALHP